MDQAAYEYKIVVDKDNDKFVAQLNASGRQGWRVHSHSNNGTLVSALLERLTKPPK